MRFAVRFSTLIYTFALLLVACQPSGTPSPTPAPQPAGVTPLYLEWASESLGVFLEKNSSARFELDIYPLNLGLDAIESGEIDLLIGAFEPSEAYFVTPLFKDGIAVIHHPDLKIRDLTIEQLRRIFSGAEQNWSALGGADLPIYPLIPLPGDDLRQIFQQRVMDTYRFSTLAKLQGSPEETLDLINEQPGAVGFVPFSQLSADSSVFRIENQSISQSSIESGRYPLTYWVVGIALDEPERALRDWLSWVQAQDS